MRAGIDLGGTKIEGIVLDHAGDEQARLRISAPQNSYTATVRAIRDLVAELESRAQAKVSHVGVGIPGTLSPATGLVKNANSTWLIGHPLDVDLEAALDRPIRVENDANCFITSEASDGAAAGKSLAFGVILGTGVGGGIAQHGRPWRGHQAIGGEWGHTPLPWPTDDERPGPECYCGLRGCVETFLSGPGLARDYETATGESLSAAVIAEQAGGGNVEAEAALTRYEDRLARALAVVINILDPDMIVLGGGLSNMDRLYDRVQPQLKAWVFSDRATTPIVKNRHGDSSGVRGAAWLWSRDDVRG